LTEATKANPGMQGERRIITALFCDVVGSTAIAEKLDPEDWAELMSGAFHHLTAPIERYQGTVAKFMGDGMLAFFGSPVAHEDDPQRAVLAALDMIGAVKTFAQTVKQEHGITFNVRIGINTGPVVMADVGSRVAMEHTAMGDAVNVAARMESPAAPGTVQISGDTYRLIAPLFDVEPLGAIPLKGKAEPMPAYRVIGLKAQPGKLRGHGGIGTRLIGRDREFNQLKGAIDRLREGRGQIVCLIGEAGLGKSRLLAELNKYWTEVAGHKQWDVMYGVPYDMSRPFGLIQNYAREMFGIQLDDPAEVIHDKVLAGIRANGGNDDVVALCSVAFERVIATKVLHEAKDFPAEQIKQDIYDQMYPGLRNRGALAPLVMVIDDLQWADVASTELLLHLLALTEEVPILFLCAFRPERQSPAWRVKVKGEVPIGEASVAVLVASAHRHAAFDASRWAMDELKRTVPVWKKEFFEAGGEGWVKGTKLEAP
jgi:class 3 adenylate cyclase